MQREHEFKGVKFAKLTRGERAKMNADLWANRRTQFVANLAAAGITGGEPYFNEVEAFDDNAAGLAPFIKAVNTDAGQVEVQLHCLRKIKPDATEDDLPEMDDGESLKLACDLSGLKLVTPDPDEEKEPEEKRPSEPVDVYTTPTGETTATTI